MCINACIINTISNLLQGINLLHIEKINTENTQKLAHRRNKSGLVFARFGIFQVVKTCEQLFKQLVLGKQAHITSEQGISFEISLQKGMYITMLI